MCICNLCRVLFCFLLLLYLLPFFFNLPDALPLPFFYRIPATMLHLIDLGCNPMYSNQKNPTWFISKLELLICFHLLQMPCTTSTEVAATLKFTFFCKDVMPLRKPIIREIKSESIPAPAVQRLASAYNYTATSSQKLMWRGKKVCFFAIHHILKYLLCFRKRRNFEELPRSRK